MLFGGPESHTHMLAPNLSSGMRVWVPGMHVTHMHTKYPHTLKKKKQGDKVKDEIYSQT